MKRSQPKRMIVSFVRTGERRYAVRAVPDGAPAVQMDPAPGFDQRMPHDMQHFIVEKCLKIDGAVFGRLAAGGTAGTFHAMTEQPGTREAARLHRKLAAKDRRVKPEQTDDYAVSERATYICWHDWLQHADDPASRARASEMRQATLAMMARMPPAERARYTPDRLREIRREFQRLSERWACLRVGESLTEPW